MFDVEYSIFINCPPQAVFDMLTTTEGILKHTTFFNAEWVTAPPHGEQSAMTLSANFLGRRIDITSTFEAWDAPNLVAWKTVGADGKISLMRNTIEAKAGGAQLRVTGQIEMGGIYKIAEPLLKAQVDKRLESNLATLKLICEEGNVQRY